MHLYYICLESHYSFCHMQQAEDNTTGIEVAAPHPFRARVLRAVLSPGWQGYLNWQINTGATRGFSLLQWRLQRLKTQPHCNSLTKALGRKRLFTSRYKLLQSQLNKQDTQFKEVVCNNDENIQLNVLHTFS